MGNLGYRLNPSTGAQMSNFNPQNQWGDINENLLGLGNDGNDLLVSTNNAWDPCLQQVDSGTGSNQGQLCADGQQGMTQAKGVSVAPDGFIAVAKNNEIVQLTPEGNENARWSGLANATDIQGLTYVSSTLFIADDDTNKVYKTTLPSGIQVSTDPLGLAYGMANNTTTLFVLVDGTPRDKVLLVDPLDGSLRSSYDAPDDDGGGLTYLGTSLYYASNGEGNPRIYELTPGTGSQLGSFIPENQWGDSIWNNLLALANDGTDILLSTQDPWDRCLKWVNGSTGNTEGQFCPPGEQGLASAAGLAITTEGGVIEAKDGTIVHVTADETFAITYQTSLTDIKGLTFVSANLYMAGGGTNTIYKATVPSGVNITTDPRALAQRTVGATTTMFILVDATPKDKILLLDPATSTLAGSYDAPDMNGQGLTYLGASLYYAGRDNDGRAKVYELDPDTGAQLSTIYPRWDWGGEVWDEPRSMGNDGNNLLMLFGTDNCMQRIDPATGNNKGASCPQSFGLGGARGLDMASDGSFFWGKNTDVVQLVSIDPDLVEVGRWSPTSTTDIQGLVFVAEVMYIADGASGNVYKASKPSGITNYPQGLAYDGTNLYILVDGALADHIIVVNPTSSAVVADFEAPDRNSNGITFLETQSTPTLFVSVTNDGPQGRQHFVYRISPTDGAQLAPPARVFADDWVDGWHGLTNDGESLVLAPTQEGFVLLLDPDTMDFESRIDFHGGSFSGFDAMAYLGSRKDFLATRGSGVFQVDKNGRFLQSFNTSLGQLKGAVVVGDTLYLADGQGSSIVAATVPAPPSTVSTSPKGMATDGEKLYLVVDGSPKDRVLVLSAGTGQVLNSYEAPGDNVDGLAWHNGDVYVVTNEYHPFKGNLPPRIYRLTSSSGAVLQEYEIQAPWGGVVEEPISGLASDGTYLYAGRRDGPQWFRLDPASPGLPADEISAQGDFMWTDYVGSLETAAAPGIPTTLLSSGWSVAGQVITRYEPDSGVVTDQFNIGNRSIEGMAYIGTVLYLADANSDTVLTATIPDNIPEITTAGDYTAALKVVSGQIASTSEPPAPISLVRNTNMQSEITAPLANFATTSSVIPIHGRVSDPSVTSVTVGVVLPFTTLLEDAVTQGASPALWDADGLWNVDCSAFWPMPMNSSEPCAWRYGVTDLPGYGQNAISKGSLTTKDPITVGPKTKLSFSTWYATEPAADVDLKLVEVAVVSTDADGNDVIGDYEALIQIVGHGFFGAPLPVDDQDVPLFRAHSSFEHREVEQELVDFDAGNQPSPRFETIVKSLHPFIGDRIMLRFRFDTVDDFANDALGWFIDDITVEGSGFKGQQTAVTPLEPPLTVGNVTWYGMFDTTFTLAEGLNRVVVAAEQPYPPKPHGPNLVGLDFVNGYLDLTGPAVTLGGIDEIVAVPSQTLEGTIDDINFTSMAITHTYLAGNGIQEKTVYAITEFPGDGTFSAPVSLLEGTNTFKATALDGSLNKSEVTFAVDLDTVAPALTPLSTSYPVGAASARAGDLVVFQASSTDALGVDRVSITLPDGSVKDMVPSDQVPEAVLDQWRTAAPWVLPMEIPSATPPGAFELTVTAIDNAGNQASASVVASVVPALEAFTFNLLPGQNLISLPLKPDTTTITDLLGAELLSAIDTIMYYDASLAGLPQEDRWLMFSPDAPSNLQTLTELRTGRGFWVRMKDDAFSFSAPLAPGLPSTPRPILFTYFGRFLEPGTVPPTYPVVPGWNLIGFHSEHPLPVTTALQSLESPQRIWASLFQYDNVIRFELDEEPEIILGGFSRVLPTGVMEPGAGFWMFMVDGGVIVP